MNDCVVINHKIDLMYVCAIIRTCKTQETGLMADLITFILTIMSPMKDLFEILKLILIQDFKFQFIH